MKLSPPAKLDQKKKLDERRKTLKRKVSVLNQKIIALKGVYDTSTDTELMADVVKINRNQTFLEIGCGTGAISLIVGKRAKKGLGVDINPIAVKNSNLNKKMLNIDNVKFIESDIFNNVSGRFDVVICNPPYSPYKPKDKVEMMFWDEKNKMKITFFDEVKNYLKPKGMVYFGYADFGDIDQDLPKSLAKKARLKFVRKFSRKNTNENRTFFVYIFKM